MALSEEERKKQAELDSCYKEWRRAADSLRACDSPENVKAMDEADRKLDAKILEVYSGDGV